MFATSKSISELDTETLPEWVTGSMYYDYYLGLYLYQQGWGLLELPPDNPDIVRGWWLGFDQEFVKDNPA